MSRKLKRRLHIVERFGEAGWEFHDHFYDRPKPSGQAKRDVARCPEVLRHVVYDRNEATACPGNACLWVVEKRGATEWDFVGLCSSVAERDRLIALTPGKLRWLRFVRRRRRVECKDVWRP
jgi:hypothetical protein